MFQTETRPTRRQVRQAHIFWQTSWRVWMNPVFFVRNLEMFAESTID